MIGGTFEVAYWLLDRGFALCLIFLTLMFVCSTILVALGFALSVIDDMKRGDSDKKNK